MRKYQLAKYRAMESLHTAEWFGLSSNKGADERGSRASISVEGLRRDPDSPATTDLRHMLHIAHGHFLRLHTPARPTPLRSASQSALLSEIAAEYRRKPAPSDIHSGAFSLDE